MSLDESEMSYPSLTVPAPNPIPTGEQICTLTRLRQRRMSTQIKMDTLQKHIHSNGHTTKKSRFTFGKKKPPSGGEDPHAPHNPDVVEQLKTLSDHLSAIDRDLVQNGGVRTLDRKLSRGRKSGSRLSQDLESSSVEASSGGGGGGARSPRLSGVDSLVNEDSGIMRSNSLKSSMQKLAHRTFARAGWYRGKKSSQESSIDRDDGDDRPSPVSEDGNLNDQHAPDVIDLTHRLMRTWPARDASQDSEEGGGEAFLPPPSSFNGADIPSPVSSPRSMRSTESTSSDKGQGQRNSRSGSSQRCHDDPRTPRRQVDPDAMATIEAFEEMSRQIIGEAPT
ncbi:hypothetical protein V1264_007768 [Littorina saxatilis]|uniref:Uncharacterized protein n=2 Tax=Littorina saxatilis TaxID=31220 RepID=A0AAN9AVL6_9CAEN